MISPLSAQITLRGVKAEVVRAFTARCTPRFRLAVLGDSWVVSSATGKQTVCASIEAAALAMAGAARFPAAPAVLADLDAAGVNASQRDTATALAQLAPADLADCLLWLAAERPGVLRAGDLNRQRFSPAR